MDGEPANMSPRVTIITATYNWSNVLRFAIESVLWQTLEDFELLVVGDGCSDDSEEVVGSFHDDRIHWHNLPKNVSNQYGPNNRGLELARGEHIAYLGQDDVWHPHHLETLTHVLDETGASLAYSIAELIGPPPQITRSLTGLALDGADHYELFVPPSSIMHQTSIVAEIGGWRDFRELRLPTDMEFLTRIRDHDKMVVPTNRLTVFKFPSTQRPNSYLEKPSYQQAEYVERIRCESDFLNRELFEIFRYFVRTQPNLVHQFYLHGDVEPGALQKQILKGRGLDAHTGEDSTPDDTLPLHSDWKTLRFLNRESDICPRRDYTYLRTYSSLPLNGLFVGGNWHTWERDANDAVYRWVENDAQIVVTKARSARGCLMIEVSPGPGVDYQAFVLQLLDTNYHVVAEWTISSNRTVEVDVDLTPAANTIFLLHTNDGGLVIDTDPRIMNFRVWRIAWK